MAQPIRYAPTPIRLAPMSDWTGGLNLRADAFQLGQNESPDMLDVTVEIGGGFVQRQVVAPYAVGTGSGQSIKNMWAFSNPSVDQMVVQTGNGSTANLKYSTGGAWTNIASISATIKARAAVFNNNLYVVTGPNAVVRWTGTTATSLGTAWNETIGGEGAADGNMPQARLICSHMGRVFIAYTTESGTDHPCRIRWSHDGFAEDWRSEDFIDIDVGRDGDVITAITEFRDRLYIFKNRSITVLTGYSTANFAVTTISQDIGAVSQEAVCNTDVGLFNFSWPQGVYLDRGTGPYPIFDKVFPLIRDGWIPSAYRSQVCMAWVNKNLWMSVPYGSGATANTRTFVYNPWIYKNRYLRFLQGPWYPYGLGISAFVTQMQTAGATLFLAAKASDQYVGQLEQNGSQDNWGGGLTNINSYMRTRWVDLGSPSVIKRWRHPDVAMRDPGSNAVLVEVRKDYDPSTLYKVFQIGNPKFQLGMQWDPGQGPTPTVSTVGTPGSSAYAYKVTAIIGGIESNPGSEATISTGNATLSGTNYNSLSWTAVPSATSYNVYGRASGVETLLGSTSSTTFNDTGQALGATSPPNQPAGGFWDDGSGLVGGKWSTLPVNAEVIARGGSMGSARAVQMSFFAPLGQYWGVDAISFKYVPKRVRG